MLVAGGFALANAAIGLADVSSDDPRSVGDHAAVLLFSAALIGAAVALAHLRRDVRGRSRRATSIALSVAVVGGALAGLGNLVEDSLGVSAFGLLFAFGGMALIIGQVAAGGLLIATRPGRMTGVALLLVATGIAVGEEPGFALVGATWIALAAFLATHPPAEGTIDRPCPTACTSPTPTKPTR